MIDHKKPNVKGKITNINNTWNGVDKTTRKPNVVTPNTAILKRNVNESKRLPPVGGAGTISCVSVIPVIISTLISTEKKSNMAMNAT